VADLTLGSTLYYTIDGTDPIKDGTNSILIPNPANLSLDISSNFTFKIRAFRDHYQPSDIVAQEFSATNFSANKISFGFASGEASSDFKASPGQFFYAPVTLNVLSGINMYSLQFNVTVTNLDAHSVEPGALAFTSTLMKLVPPNFGDHLPP